MLVVNEELISKMSPEQQVEVQADIARRKEEIKDQEVKQAEEKKQAELRKFPPLNVVFDRIKIRSCPHIKNAILKRIHIILDYLKMPALPEGIEPTLEYSLGLLGRAEISLSLIEEIGKILSDALGYSLIKIYPREAVELREHIRAQQKIANKLVLAIVFQKIKLTGMYEPKDKEPDRGDGM